jgi:hypothetical protein
MEESGVCERKGRRLALEKLAQEIILEERQEFEEEVRMQLPMDLDDAMSEWAHLKLEWNPAESGLQEDSTLVIREHVVVGLPKLNKSEIRLPLGIPAIIRDDRGGIVLRVFRSVLDAVDLQTLLDSTIALTSAKSKHRTDLKRGVDCVFHLGCWRSYTQQPFVTSGSRTQAVKTWIETNRGVFRKLNNLFMERFPALFRRYMSVEMPVRMFGAWAAVAINCGLQHGVGIRLHRDAHDYRGGLCWTIPFGEFNGGDLLLPELKLRLEYAAGDVCAFQSLQQHQVLPFSGKNRFSMVLFSHNTLFNTYEPK